MRRRIIRRIIRIKILQIVQILQAVTPLQILQEIQQQIPQKHLLLIPIPRTIQIPLHWRLLFQVYKSTSILSLTLNR
jgi:hypothetical protein